MAQLQQTRLKLTIILSTIVALLFLIIGGSFFGFKFYNDRQTIIQESEKIEEVISTQEKDISQFVKNAPLDNSDSSQESQEVSKILEFTRKLFQNQDVSFDDMGEKKEVSDIIIKGETEFSFFDHKVLFYNTSEKKILYSNIGNNNEISIESYLYSPNGLIFNTDLGEYKFQIGNITGIAFLKREYSTKEFISDTLYLIGFILLFSLVFFGLGSFFIKKIFEPVEENIREMDDFIDNAGHELKTPLAAIQSSSSLMKELKDFEPELIQEIIDETNKSSEIIGALRSLSKISKNAELETFTAQKIITEIFSAQKTLATSKEVTLSFSGTDDLEIIANKNYFYIMMSNLITNAIKYNKKGGTVTAEIGDGYIIIADSGVGIAKQDTNKIFQRFHRLKNSSGIEGFGLGLSMVEKICKIYKWKIEVESLEGIGTKVKIMF